MAGCYIRAYSLVITMKTEPLNNCAPIKDYRL